MRGEPAFERPKSPRFENRWIDGQEWMVARAGRNWLVLPLLLFWLSMWTFGGLAAIAQVLAGPDRAFLIIWLVFWAFGWLFAASWLAWMIGGLMMLSADRVGLTYKWSMPGFSKTRRYDAREIRRVRSGSTAWPFGSGFMRASYPPFTPFAPGSIQIDYGARTIGLMPGLDEAEGHLIADWLLSRLPTMPATG